MAFSVACREASKASMAIDSTLQQSGRLDRLAFRAAMEPGVLPDDASASVEFRWMAVQLVMNVHDVPYETAPSKAAAAWIRRMRWKSGKSLKDRFWEESWPFYMDSRLALELKTSVPAAAKKAAGKGGKTDGDVQSQIERMGTRGV